MLRGRCFGVSPLPPFFGQCAAIEMVVTRDLAKKWVAPFAIKEAMKSEISPELRKTTTNRTIDKRAPPKLMQAANARIHLYTESALAGRKMRIPSIRKSAIRT